MYKEMSKRVICLLLCAAMLLGNFPAVSFAAEPDGLCEHHTVHTADCGYAAAVAGVDCVHTHTEDCYRIVNCIHKHTDDSCGENSADCTHECTAENGCITTKLDCHHLHGNCGYSEGTAEVPCGHRHDESCGYVEAVAGTPCANAETDPECDHTGDCGFLAAVEGVACSHTEHTDCGYAPATEGTPCTHVCEVKVSSDDSCYKRLCTHAKSGQHDDTCGYIEAMAGHACNYECVECGAEETEPETEALEESSAPTDEPTQPIVPEETSAPTEQPTEHIEETAAPTETLTVQTESVSHEAALTSAISGTCGAGLTWTISNGVLTISGSGTMKDYNTYSNHAPWYEYASSITSIVIGEGVSSLGADAFYKCNQVKSIYIPAGVTTIPDTPFSFTASDLVIYCAAASEPDDWESGWECNRDVHFAITPADYSFWSTVDKTASIINIPTGVTQIIKEAFSKCSNLTKVTIPDTVTTIMFGAFEYCDGLQTIYIPANVSNIYTCYSTTLRICPFQGCSSSLEIYCGADYKPSGWEIFWDSFSSYAGESLTVHFGYQRSEYEFWTSVPVNATTLEIPEYITHIPAQALENHTSLQKIVIPNSVKTIEAQAFLNCSNLKEVVFSDGLLSIGDQAFYGCKKLEKVEIPSTLTSIGSKAFYNCTGLETVVLCDNLLSIGNQAFYFCSSLIEIVIPDSVTSMGKTVFGNCSALTDVKLGSGLTQIPTQTFYKCTGLTEIDIPSNIVSIEANAFDYCSGLAKIYIPSTVASMPSGSSSAFRNCCADLMIYCEHEAAPSSWGKWNNDLTVSYGYSENEYEYWTNLDLTGTSFVIEESITRIPERAFYNATNLTDVYIHDSVTYIGAYAFEGCTNLLNIYVPASATKNCSAKAFSNANYYLNVYFGAEREALTGSVYAHFGYTRDEYDYWMTVDKEVSSITIREGITKIPDRFFSGSTYIGDTELDFENETLRSVTIPASVQYIGKDAFKSCVNLTRVTLNEGLESIEEYAFYNCCNLATLKVPASAKKVSSSAFYSCNSLNIQYTGTKLEWMVVCDEPTPAICSDGRIFDCGECGTEVYWMLDDSYTLTIFGNGEMENYQYYDFVPWYEYTGYDSYYSYIKSIKILDGVTSIGTRAFFGCVTVTTATIPESVKNIEAYAFSNCIKLKSITIPRSVNYIGVEAFYNDQALATITFRHGPQDNLMLDMSAFVLFGSSKKTTNVKVPVKSQINLAIKDYDWSGDMRNVTYSSHNCDGKHYETFDGAIEGNCTVDGWTGKRYCEVCNKVLSENTIIPAPGHKEVVDAGVAATCTEDGVTEGKHCKVCGEVLIEQIPVVALGHDHVVLPAVAPTCVSTGLTEGEGCSRCETIFVEQETIEQLAHVSVETEYVAPTCTEEGMAAGVMCDSCKGTLSGREIIDALGHTEVTDAAVAPTCTETGLTEGSHCSVCSEIFVAQETIPALGHVEVTDSAVMPTCMQTGLTEGSHCYICEEIIVAQEVLPATGHAYEKQNDQLVCNTCGQEVYVRIRQDYLAMDLISFREAYLDLQVSHEELRNEINWTVEGDSVALDAENLCLTVEKLGNAWITATVTVSNGLDKTDEHYEEFEVSSHCRVEVAESIQLKGIQLSTATVTTELFKSDYTSFEVLLQLPDYYSEETASTYSLRRTSMMERARLIRVDKDGNEVEDLSPFFELEIMDDRTVRIIPTRYALDHPTEVASKYSNLKVAVEVQGKKYTSENLTLTVKKTAPKVTGTVAAFNSFYNGQTQQIVIKGATPVENGFSENEAKTAAIPYWLELNENGTLQLSDNAPQKSIGTQKAYIMVQTEEWRNPVAVTLSVKNTFKAPGLKLSATSVTMSSLTDSSNGMAMKLLCTNKKDTLSGLNVKNITASDGFAVENFNIRDGSFVLRAPEGFKAAPKGTPVTLTVKFNNTTVTRDYKLTVKTAAVALKLGTTSITLNRRVSDSIRVKVTSTPADYRLDIREDQDIRLTATEKVNGKNTTVDKTDSGELSFCFENGELIIQTTAQTPETATYKLYVKSGDSKEVSATVKVISGKPSVTFKTTGSMDLSFPNNVATIKPAFKNYKGEITGFDYAVSELKGSKVVSENVKEKFDVTFNGTSFEIRCIDDEANTSNTYKVKLILTLNDGSTIENAISLKVKRTAVKLKLSSTKLTLNKLIGDEGSIAVSCATKGYAFTKPIVKQVTDKYKQPAENQLNIRYADGRLYIATNEDTVYGMAYTVSLQANEKAAVQNITVTIPTEAKSKVTVSLKASGKIDVIRDGSAVTVTPTYKNRLTATPAKEELYIYNAADRSKACVNHLFDIQSNGKGGYSITKAEGVTLPTGTYKVRFEATFGTTKMDPKEVSMTVTMGSTKLTNQVTGSTLFSKDRNDMAFIQFEAADAMLNDVLKVEIKDTKYKDAFEIIDCGDGLFAIGYKGGKIHSAIANLILKKNATITLNLNVYMDGNPTMENKTPKVNTTAKVKLTIVK